MGQTAGNFWIVNLHNPNMSLTTHYLLNRNPCSRQIVFWSSGPKSCFVLGAEFEKTGIIWVCRYVTITDTCTARCPFSLFGYRRTTVRRLVSFPSSAKNKNLLSCSLYGGSLLPLVCVPYHSVSILFSYCKTQWGRDDKFIQNWKRREHLGDLGMDG
jgi:hypothetical protein